MKMSDKKKLLIFATIFVAYWFIFKIGMADYVILLLLGGVLLQLDAIEKKLDKD